MSARPGTSVEAWGNMAVKWIFLLILTFLVPVFVYVNGGECTVYPSAKYQTSSAAFGRTGCADFILGHSAFTSMPPASASSFASSSDAGRESGGSGGIDCAAHLQGEACYADLMEAEVY